MKSLISLLVFTVPGLVAYVWINLFGITPTSKKENSEVVSISAILWIPIVSIVLLIYQLIAEITHYNLIQPTHDIPLIKKNWPLIKNISDLNKLSENIWFLFFYVVSSIIISFYIAKFISNKGYKFILNKVNKIREDNGIAPLSQQTTVWNSMFLENTGQIVELNKIDDASFSLIGCLIKVPRAHEPNKSIVLEATDHWGKVMEYYNVNIDNVYVDLDSGTIIKIYNSEQARQAQDMFNQRVNDGTISLV